MQPWEELFGRPTFAFPDLKICLHVNENGSKNSLTVDEASVLAIDDCTHKPTSMLLFVSLSLT